MKLDFAKSEQNEAKDGIFYKKCDSGIAFLLIRSSASLW